MGIWEDFLPLDFGQLGGGVRYFVPVVASSLHINRGANDVANGLAMEGVLRLYISFDV